MGYLLDFSYDWTTLDHNVTHKKGNLHMQLKLVDEHVEGNESDDANISDLSGGQLEETSPL
jgi:hypothetical protein